jgi:ABC-type multidrug transport system ATPase subunit
VVHEDMTVRENILFNAIMRLPQEMTYAQKIDIVNDTIKILGLFPVQDSIVGSVEKRGISGGQRKRVNIGMELVSDPDVLFLDEPT